MWCKKKKTKEEEIYVTKNGEIKDGMFFIEDLETLKKRKC